ncbi:MAG: ABC transporter substrate-binding protein [Thermomicrobiales bacterium]
MIGRTNPGRSNSTLIISRRTLLTASIGTVAGVALAACGGENEPTIVTPPGDAFIPEVIPTTIQIANGNIMADAPLLVALERGNFSAETLEPVLQRTDEQELIDLLIQGGTEITLTSAGPAFFNALQGGHDLKIIGPVTMDVPPLSTPLIVARERFDSGEITSVADLRGGTVGIARAGFTEYLLGKTLEPEGLTLDDVRIDLNSDRRLRTRLERGLIDAAMIAEPDATEALFGGQAVVLSDQYLPGYTATFAMTTGGYLTENAGTVSAFFNVIYRSCAEMLENGFNSPRNQTIFQLYNGRESSVLAQMRPYGCTETGAVDVDEVMGIQRFYLDRGMLNLTNEIAPDDFIDDALAREAAESVFPA